MKELSRRDFLKLARNGLLYLSGGLALVGLFRFIDYETNPEASTEFEIGHSTNYPPGSRTVLLEPPALLIHDEKGFSAVSLVCTHLGCTVESTLQGFECPCHGSRFDAEGNVASGPARKRLQAVRVEVTNQGNLKLFTV